MIFKTKPKLNTGKELKTGLTDHLMTEIGKMGKFTAKAPFSTLMASNTLDMSGKIKLMDSVPTYLLMGEFTKVIG